MGSSLGTGHSPARCFPAVRPLFMVLSLSVSGRLCESVPILVGLRKGLTRLCSAPGVL